MVNNWLTWELREDYKEDAIIKRMIGLLEKFRETERQLIKLHGGGAQIGRSDAVQKLRIDEQTCLHQLAKNLRLLMVSVGHDVAFDKKFLATRLPRIKY